MLESLKFSLHKRFRRYGGIFHESLQYPKLARIFYRLWTSGGNYQDPGIDYYEQRYHQRVVNNLQKRAQSLGFELIPQSTAETIS